MAAKHRPWGSSFQIACVALVLAASGYGLVPGELLSAPVAAAGLDRNEPPPARVVERPMLAQVDRSAGGGERELGLELDGSGGFHDFIAEHTYEAATEPNVGIRCVW